MLNRAVPGLVAIFALSAIPLEAGRAQSFGGAGGLNIADLISSPQDFSRRFGGLGGFNTSSRINGLMRLLLEAQLSQKGATGDSVRIQPDTVAGRVRFNYVEFPAQIRILLPGKATRLFLNGGGAVAVRFTCDLALYSPLATPVATDDCKGSTGAELVEGVDWSWIAGAGLDFHALGGTFARTGIFQSIELRMVNGFVPVTSDAAPKALRPARNRVISFMVRLNAGR